MTHTAWLIHNESLKAEFRTENPDQVGPVRVSGPPDRTNLSRSGIPDQRTGPMLAGPDFRTTGPDQVISVRNSGPTDRTKKWRSGIPDQRTGPDQLRTGGPGIHDWLERCWLIAMVYETLCMEQYFSTFFNFELLDLHLLCHLKSLKRLDQIKIF